MYNIVYITDENYILPTKTSINSIVRSITGTEMTVHVIAVDVSKESKESLQKLESKNIKIRVLEFGNDFADLGLDHHYVSKAALFKFQLPNIFTDLDTILYVDGDTIFYLGFESIFDTDIENAYAAATMDMCCMKLGEWHRKLGHNRYFNSGMMYLNLKKMRNDHISEKLIEYKKNDMEKAFMDQNALNSCFEEKIIWMNPVYNFLDAYMQNFSKIEIEDFFGISGKDINYPKIRHLAGGIKPWLSSLADNSNDWIPFVKPEDSLKVAKNWCDSLSADFSKRLTDQQNAFIQKTSEQKGLIEALRNENAELNSKISALQQALVESQNELRTQREKLAELHGLILNTRHRTLYGACAWLWHKVFK